MGSQTCQNRKHRNQNMVEKLVEKIASGPIVAAIYSEAEILIADESYALDLILRSTCAVMPMS